MCVHVCGCMCISKHDSYVRVNVYVRVSMLYLYVSMCVAVNMYICECVRVCVGTCA